MTSGIAQDLRSPSFEGINYRTENALKAATSIETAQNLNSLASCAAFSTGITTLWEGGQYFLYSRNNKKLNGTMTKDMLELSNTTQKAAKNLFNGREALGERIGKYFSVINHNQQNYSQIRNIASAKASLPQKEKTARKAAHKALKNPGIFNINEKLANRAEKKFLKTAQNAAQKINPGTGEKLTFGKFLKLTGARTQAAFVGIIEAVTEVIPTFIELGPEKGMKQLGKSGVKVIGNTAGFLAGQQIGMAIGSAIGTALFPGIGTVIGAASGIIAGSIFAYGTDNLTEKIIGKSELEIANEQKNQSNNKSLFSVTV